MTLSLCTTPGEHSYLRRMTSVWNLPKMHNLMHTMGTSMHTWMCHDLIHIIDPCLGCFALQSDLEELSDSQPPVLIYDSDSDSEVCALSRVCVHVLRMSRALVRACVAQSSLSCVRVCPAHVPRSRACVCSAELSLVCACMSRTLVRACLVPPLLPLSALSCVCVCLSLSCVRACLLCSLVKCSLIKCSLINLLVTPPLVYSDAHFEGELLPPPAGYPPSKPICMKCLHESMTLSTRIQECAAPYLDALLQGGGTFLRRL
jgi:hypothetical protein